MIKATPRFADLAEIIENMPGLGRGTSAGLTGRCRNSARSVTKLLRRCWVLRLTNDDSGKRRGDRHIQGGRRKVRNLFYVACMGSATRHNPVLKVFYDRLIAKGKELKVALTTCMRKLIVILNIMIARGETRDINRYGVSNPARLPPSACPA